MLLALSPYDLIARTTAAATALILADHVVTLLPAPLEDEPVADAAGTDPRFLQVLERWRWTTRFWHTGLLVAGIDGDTPINDLRAVCARLAADPLFAPLRPLLAENLLDDSATFLAHASRDLLRGGGDPGVSVPVAAAIASFAARHRLTIIRLEDASLAGRARRAAGDPLLRCSIPTLRAASDAGIAAVRDRLAEPLDDLRDHLARVIDAAPDTDDGELADEASRAADRYADAFADARPAILRAADDAGDVAAPVAVALALRITPADALLRDAVRAVVALRRSPSAHSRHGTPAPPGHAPSPGTSLDLPPVPHITLKHLPWDV